MGLAPGGLNGGGGGDWQAEGEGRGDRLFGDQSAAGARPLEGVTWGSALAWKEGATGGHALGTRLGHVSRFHTPGPLPGQWKDPWPQGGGARRAGSLHGGGVGLTDGPLGTCCLDTG